MGVYNSFCAYAISINFFLCWPIYYINNVLKYAFGIVTHEDNYNSVLHCLYSDRLHRARYDNNIIG